jgi:hemerythrin-like metal-binding protein
MHVTRTADPSLIEWDAAAFAIGVADMDAAHKQFIDLLNQLDGAVNSEFAALFTRLLEHTRAHFEDEEARMQLCGFPAIAEHSGEHRRVLGELTQIKRQVDKGLVSFGRCYVREGLPGWFRLHAATMDSALAAHWRQHEASTVKTLSA